MSYHSNPLSDSFEQNPFDMIGSGKSKDVYKQQNNSDDMMDNLGDPDEVAYKD
jgi:hypothetical protein